jgi:intermediate peptidase
LPNVPCVQVLKAVLSDPSLVKSLGPEEYQTALIFWRDFEKSAINLPPEQRQKFVSLSSEILSLGREFLENASTPRPPALIQPEHLAGIKDKGMGIRLQLQAHFTKRELLVYPGSLQAQMIMRSAPDEEPRRRLYVASNSSAEKDINTLEGLLRARAELARLVGRQSFAHMTLDDKMAKTPGEWLSFMYQRFHQLKCSSTENVVNFLDALRRHTRPSAESALRALSARKQAHHGLSSPPIIQAWDRDFYCPPEPPSPPVPLPPLTLGTVFVGLSRLFKHLYGITLRPTDAQAGEVWHSDVQKLEVIDEDKGLIGWIYADLFARYGKASGAAHYTVRCSRRTDLDDEQADGTAEGYEELVKQSVDFENSKRHKLPNQDGVYQLPLVVLLCEFARPSLSKGPTVLEWQDVTTLFHEMGHAMHCE